MRWTKYSKTSFNILDIVQNDDYRGSITAKVKFERNFRESGQVWKMERKTEIKMSKVEGYFLPFFGMLNVCNLSVN